MTDLMIGVFDLVAGTHRVDLLAVVKHVLKTNQL